MYRLNLKFREESKGIMDFHYQLMEPLFRKAAKKPAKILDMTDVLRRHKTKKWKKVPIKDKTKIINHQTACWANIHEITRFDIETNNWAGFSYHYLIDRKGYIMQANELTDMCYHAKGCNYNGIGVALLGRFYAVKCDGIEFVFTHSTLDKGSNKKKIATPTNKQLVSLIQIWDYLLSPKVAPNITIDNLLGHCHINPRSRVCDPGDSVMILMAVYKYRKSLDKKFEKLNI